MSMRYRFALTASGLLAPHCVLAAITPLPSASVLDYVSSVIWILLLLSLVGAAPWIGTVDWGRLLHSPAEDAAVDSSTEQEPQDRRQADNGQKAPDRHQEKLKDLQTKLTDLKAQASTEGERKRVMVAEAHLKYGTIRSTQELLDTIEVEFKDTLSKK